MSGQPPVFPAEATRVSGRRYVAHLFDATLYLVLFWLLILVAGQSTDVVLVLAIVLGLTVLHVGYFVALQRNGRTVGKLLARIRVVDAGGKPPTKGALVRRSIPLLIEYFYVIALVGMLTSEYRQRFGDRWAGTYVVRA